MNHFTFWQKTTVFSFGSLWWALTAFTLSVSQIVSPNGKAASKFLVLDLSTFCLVQIYNKIQLLWPKNLKLLNINLLSQIHTTVKGDKMPDWKIYSRQFKLALPLYMETLQKHQRRQIIDPKAAVCRAWSELAKKLWTFLGSKWMSIIGVLQLAIPLHDM